MDTGFPTVLVKCGIWVEWALHLQVLVREIGAPRLAVHEIFLLTLCISSRRTLGVLGPSLRRSAELCLAGASCANPSGGRCTEL